MRVCVYGLGYVGTVGAGCLAGSHEAVVGVDTNPTKVQTINKGRSTVAEKDLDALVRKSWEAGRLRATLEPVEPVSDCDVSLICVGTPTTRTGAYDLRSVFAVAEAIGRGLADGDGFHVVAIRSTVPPGTNRRVGEIVEEYSHRRRGERFEVVSNPEFLREGVAVCDFFDPPVTVIGTDSEAAFKVMQQLYREVRGTSRMAACEVAELLKIVCNSFHALKVCFANEIGNLCKNIGIDSHAVMDLLCEDRKLSISPSYLRPGAPYGGSCLPKDLRALTRLAHDVHLEMPVVNAIQQSNEQHKRRIINTILDTGIKDIAVLGLSFKEGTDDLRESPVVEIVEALFGKGRRVRIYDEYVHRARLIGTNLAYIQARIPHLQKLVSDDLADVVDGCGLVLVAHNKPNVAEFLASHNDKTVIDLVRLKHSMLKREHYNGLCW
jgi:GDP-mannose 6-dehydrogenase